MQLMKSQASIRWTDIRQHVEQQNYANCQKHLKNV